jgi:hypothetical protein
MSNYEPTLEELLNEIVNVNSRLILENAAMKIKIAKMQNEIIMYEESIKESVEPFN